MEAVKRRLLNSQKFGITGEGPNVLLLVSVVLPKLSYHSLPNFLLSTCNILERGNSEQQNASFTSNSTRIRQSYKH